MTHEEIEYVNCIPFIDRDKLNYLLQKDWQIWKQAQED